jgi:pimeloyl-ACP methyl ester carboxylesterase
MMTRRNVVQAGLATLAAVATTGSATAQAATLVRRIEGHGEPVFLIAGYSCDLTVWDALTPLIVARGFRVIRFNNRGVGRDTHFLPDDVTIPLMARQAADLLAALQLPSVHVVGHSMGGQIAQELALTVPGRVRSLTLLSTWGKPTGRFSGLLTELSTLAGVVSPEEWQRNFLPWVLTDAAYAAPGLIDQIVRANAKNPDRPSAALLQAQAAAIAASDTSSRLSELKSPTLVAVGEKDILTPPAYSHEVNSAIVGSAFDLLPGGHGLIAEAAPQLADRLASFHREHSIN